MASRQSAGIVLYRRRGPAIEVLLVHPGGPYWAKKDAGAWSIPKGEFGAGEAPADAARREFIEEIGHDPGAGLVPLGTFVQSRAKTVHAFAVEGDLDPATVTSNTFAGCTLCLRNSSVHAPSSPSHTSMLKRLITMPTRRLRPPRSCSNSRMSS